MTGDNPTPKANMSPDMYQLLASRTLPSRSKQEHTNILCLGLATEAGEVIQFAQKQAEGKRDIDDAALSKEIGDALWYLSMLAHVRGLSLSSIMEENIKKLEERHPTGFVVPGNSSERLGKEL